MSYITENVTALCAKAICALCITYQLNSANCLEVELVFIYLFASVYK